MRTLQPTVLLEDTRHSVSWQTIHLQEQRDITSYREKGRETPAHRDPCNCDMNVSFDTEFMRCWLCIASNVTYGRFRMFEADYGTINISSIAVCKINSLISIIDSCFWNQPCCITVVSKPNIDCQTRGLSSELLFSLFVSIFYLACREENKQQQDGTFGVSYSLRITIFLPSLGSL